MTIYQVGEADGLIFIAMKWVPGESLESRLNKVTYLDETQLKSIGCKICDGLTAAHQQNLIHRDIKPANIWLTEGSDEPIILDFGLARIAHDDPGMTATGMIAGTPNYMSPEQAKGLELDARSDLFSLGCVFYRAATGKLPFSGTGILSTLQAIQNESPRPPVTLNPHLSVDFSDLTMGLLEKQPGNRPGSAADLNQALTNPRKKWPLLIAQAGEMGAVVMGEGARNTTAIAKSSPGRRSRGRRSAVAWMVGLVVCAAMGWGGYQYRNEIIRIATNQGVLEIDCRDEAVKVEVLQNGELVSVVDTKTMQKLNVESGTYQLKLKDGLNGFELSADSVVMTRGGEAIVTVTKIGGELAADKPQVKKLQKPVYNGMPLADWKLKLRWETSTKQYGEALTAISRLLQDQPQLKDRETFALLIESMGKRNSHEPNAARLMTGFDPEWVFEWVNDAAGSQDLEKLKFSRYVFSALKSDSRINSRIAVLSNSETLSKIAFKSVDWEGEPELASSAIDFAFGMFEMSAGTRFEPILERFLLDELERLPRNRRFELASRLLFADRTNEQVFAAIADVFENPSTAPLPNVISTLERLVELKDACSPQLLANAALRLAKNPEFSSGPVFKSQRHLMRDGVLALRRFRGTPSDESKFRKRVYAIELLGKLGAESEVALPYLDELAKDELLGDLALAASKTIRKEIQAEREKAGSGEGEQSKEPKIGIGGSSPAAELEQELSPAATTYEGRTLEQWMNILKTDVHGYTIITGVQALGILGAGASEKLQAELFELVRTLVREYGNGHVNGGVSREVVRFFGYFPPEKVYDWVLAEIPNSNVKSMSHLGWYVVEGVVYERRPEMLPVQSAVLEKRKVELATALLNSINHADPKRDQAAIDVLKKLLGQRAGDFTGKNLRIAKLVLSKFATVEDASVKLSLSLLIASSDLGYAEKRDFWLARFRDKDFSLIQDLSQIVAAFKPIDQPRLFETLRVWAMEIKAEDPLNDDLLFAMAKILPQDKEVRRWFRTRCEGLGASKVEIDRLMKMSETGSQVEVERPRDQPAEESRTEDKGTESGE